MLLKDTTSFFVNHSVRRYERLLLEGPVKKLCPRRAANVPTCQTARVPRCLRCLAALTRCVTSSYTLVTSSQTHVTSSTSCPD